MEWLTKQLMSSLDFETAREFLVDIFKEPLLDWVKQQLTEAAADTETELDDKIAENLCNWIEDRLKED
jgi:hypothetical protein